MTIVRLIAVLVATGLPPSARADGSATGGEGFAQLLRESQAEITDISFVYEGNHIFVGDPELVDVPLERMGYSYQGLVASRADGPVLLDIYKWSHDGIMPMARSTTIIRDDETTIVARVPDTRTIEPRILPTANYRALYGQLSFFAIDGKFRVLHLEDLDACNFTPQGWEMVEGRRCLRVQVDSLPNDPRPEPLKYTYYFDLERGGHAIQIDISRGSSQLARAKIRLGQMPLPDGRMVWYPLGGVSESFMWSGKKYANAVIRDTIEVIPSTIRLNEPPPDELFTVAGADNYNQSPDLKRTRLKFERPPPPPPREKTDRASVQKRLDETLARADEQSKQLEASAPTRERWGLTSVLQVIFGSLGVLALGGAVFWKWRYR